MSNAARIEANLKAMPVGSEVSRKSTLGYHVGTVTRHTKTRIMVQWFAGAPEKAYSAQSCEEIGYRRNFPDKIFPYKPWHKSFNKLKECESDLRKEQDKLKPVHVSHAEIRKAAQRLIELCDTHEQLTAEIEEGRKDEYSPWGF